MKRIALCLGIIVTATMFTLRANNSIQNTTSIEVVEATVEIKIKNDTDDEVRVVTGRGAHYSLTKGATTTIKLEEGDWLYTEKGGNKDAKIIQGSTENAGQTFNLSKLLQ